VNIAVFARHKVSKVKHAASVAPLVVVPSHQLYESRVQRDAGVGVEDRRKRAVHEVLGDDGILCVSKDALELALCRGFHRSLNLIVGGVFAQANGKIDNGDVGCWNSEGHSSQLSFESRDHLADSLCCASR